MAPSPAGGDAIPTGQSVPPEGRFTSVSAGLGHTCGVKEDGSVACWKGDDAWGQAALPEGRFTSVSSGWRHTCGVKEDGTVACWGSDGAQDLATPPEGPFTSVSVGGTLVCGVRTDGAVVCWGASSGSHTSLPAGPFRSLSVSSFFACGVREDRTVACRDLHGVSPALDEMTPPEGAFTSVDLGDSTSLGESIGLGVNTACGVREDGRVVCWGDVDIPSPVLSITGRTSDSLTIQWLDPSETGAFDYYQIHASSSPEGPHNLVASSLDEGTHVHDGLEPDTAYYFVVLACNQFGCSSEVMVATTESDGPVSIPSTPAGYRGKKVEIDGAPDDAKITWEPAAGTTYYELWKGSDPDIPFKLLIQINAPLEAQSVDIAPNRGLFGDYSLTSWKVRACNKAGCSAFSKTVTIR